MPRISKKPDLYKEAWKRTARDTVEERDLGYGRLLDYNHGAKVELFWNENQEMHADSLCRLRITKHGVRTEVILDVEELQRFLRWV